MTKQQHVPDDDPSGTVVSSGGVDRRHCDPAAVPATAYPDRSCPGDHAASEATADAVARLAESDLSTAERRQALGEIAAGLRKRGFKDIFRPKAAMAWVADTVVDIAPRIPVRSLETLREHFPG